MSYNTKALANLVMGLASQTFAKSVVEISLSKTYHYQHSSINKTIDSIDKRIKQDIGIGKDKIQEKESRLAVEKKFTN